MNRSEQEFWGSRVKKVIRMIDMYADKKMMEAAKINNENYESKYFEAKENAKAVTSMKDIEGW